MRKLFIGGLNHATTTESLREYFSAFGEITNCIVMTDPVTKKSRGFGFVVYADPASVDAAQAARPHVVDGRNVDSKRAMPKGETAKHTGLGTAKTGGTTRRIFMGGLKTTTTEDTVHEYFSRYGVVEKVDLPEDKISKRKRGFGYVTFVDSDTVDKVTILKYHTIDDRKCEVKKALTKAEMEQVHSMERGGTTGGAWGQQYAGTANDAAAWSNGMAANNSMGMGAAGMGMNQNMGMGGAMGGMCGPMGGMGGPMGGMDPAAFASYMANMAQMFSSCMPGMMGNAGQMGNMGNRMMGAAGGDMSGAGNWGPMDNPPAPKGAPGKVRRETGFSQRASGPYGGGYGSKPQPPAPEPQAAAVPSYSAYGGYTDQQNAAGY